MNISIIIPTLNEEKYIGKLLYCLGKQTFKCFEIIVVDGQSKDKTEEVVLKYVKRLRLKFVLADKKGVSYQRNLGAKTAKYNWMLFLDADVTFENLFLEKSLEEINRRKLEIASAGIGSDLKRWYYLIFFFTINQIMKISQFFSKGGFGASLFISKALFDKVGGFDTSLKCVVDHDLIKRASIYGKFGFLSTRFTHSVRRFEKHGTKKTMAIWGREMFLFLTKGAKEVNSKIEYKYGDY